jgi:hypothetical protein
MSNQTIIREQFLEARRTNSSVVIADDMCYIYDRYGQGSVIMAASHAEVIAALITPAYGLKWEYV